MKGVKVLKMCKPSATFLSRSVDLLNQSVFSQTEMCICSSNKKVSLPVVDIILIMIEVTVVELSRSYSSWNKGLV